MPQPTGIFSKWQAFSVSVTPTDLLGQKTALFGMTRTENQTPQKIVLKLSSRLRWAVADARGLDSLCSIQTANMQTKMSKTRPLVVIIQTRSKMFGGAHQRSTNKHCVLMLFTYGNHGAS